MVYSWKQIIKICSLLEFIFTSSDYYIKQTTLTAEIYMDKKDKIPQPDLLLAEKREVIEIAKEKKPTPEHIRNFLIEESNENVFKYIDSMGLFAQLANKLFLHQSQPNISQIKFWDGVLMPLSKIIDKILFYRFGKNLVAVFQRI